MSWNPLLEAGYPDAVAIDAIETLIVPRAVDLGGFRGAPRPSLSPAADDRSFHLLRPLRTGGDSRRAGSRRASPPPYRARDRHLSLSRRDPASRQRGVETDHPAGRRQLDGGWARHYPFRANAAPRSARSRTAVMGFRPGSRCRMPTRTRPQASRTTPRRRCRSSRVTARASGSFLAAPTARPRRRGCSRRRSMPTPSLQPGARHSASRRPRGARRLHPRRIDLGRRPVVRGRTDDGVPAEGPRSASRRVLTARGSFSLAARRSLGRATSGGISWLPAGRRSTSPRSNGAKATGASASSTFRPTIATNSFRCRREPIRSKSGHPPGPERLDRLHDAAQFRQALEPADERIPGLTRFLPSSPSKWP